jgi:di/tricarboxylate transporter
MQHILGSAKAIVPLLLLAILSLLEQLGVSIEIDWDLFGTVVGGAALTWLVPNTPPDE